MMLLIRQMKIWPLLLPLAVIALLSCICALREEYKKLIRQCITFLESFAEKDLDRVLLYLSLKLTPAHFQLIRVIASFLISAILSAVFPAFFPVVFLLSYSSIYDIAKLISEKRKKAMNKLLPQLIREIALKSAVMPLEEAIREVNSTFPSLMSEDFEALAAALKQPVSGFKTFARVTDHYRQDLEDIAFYLSALYTLKEKEECRGKLLAFIEAHET